MIESREEWFELARTYIRANAGGLLSGIVHNLQNSVHAAIMQLDLWKQHLQQSPEPDAGMLEKTLNRLQATTQDQIRFCQDLEQRSFYIRESEARLDVQGFCDWLRRFWINDLFFKHHVSFEVETAPDTPATISLPPMLLTLCLEEPLKNALEECLSLDRHGQFAIGLSLSPSNSGILFELRSETTLPQDLDPWQQGSTNKRGHLGLGLPLVGFLSSLAGWSCALKGDGGMTVFSLKLPHGQTLAPAGLDEG